MAVISSAALKQRRRKAIGLLQQKMLIVDVDVSRACVH
jgi:hypothetical protein